MEIKRAGSQPSGIRLRARLRRDKKDRASHLEEVHT